MRWFRARQRGRSGAPSIGSAHDLAAMVGSSARVLFKLATKLPHRFACCDGVRRRPTDAGLRLTLPRRRPDALRRLVDETGRMLLTDFCNRLADTCT